MSLFSDTVLLLIVVAFIFWWLHQASKDKKNYKNIPGPPTIPILGNALDFGSTKDLLNILDRYRKEYGEIVKFQIGPVHKFFLVSDYKFLECILSSTKLLKKSDDYKPFLPWLGTGLLTSDGPKWRTHRRVLTPAFHFQILEQFLEVFESCGNRLLEKLEEHIGKNNVDIYPLVTLCALDVICESTMGVTINAQSDANSEYVQSVKDMCRIVIERTLSPLQMYDLLYPLSKNYYTQKKALKILHAQTNSVIAQKKKELDNKSVDVTLEDNFGLKKRKAFLDILLEIRIDGKPLTHEEIREEVDTFMFEGHDTTASAISFALFCLANHQDIQEKVLTEQREIFGNNKNPLITYESLQKMRYLEQVIKETLRIYPSVPLYGRLTNEEIEFGDTTFSPGDTLIIFAFGIHRNPKYFKDPEEFNPSRFNDIDGKLPYAYVPFSAGPRNCIGQKFAMLEMKSTISKVIRYFELHPTTPKHEPQLAAESILKSANGIKIRLNLRE